MMWQQAVLVIACAMLQHAHVRGLPPGAEKTPAKSHVEGHVIPPPERLNDPLENSLPPTARQTARDVRRGRSSAEYMEQEALHRLIELELRKKAGRSSAKAPIEWNGLIEGDVVPTTQDLQEMYEEILNPTRRKRKITSNTNNYWTMPVHYVVDSALPQSYVDAINSAIAEWEALTCVTFEETTTPTGNYIKFVYESGCWSYIGMIGGEQKISIGPNCNSHGIAAHEIGHALGFHHEQMRSDRDDHVTVNLANVQSGRESNFNKKSESSLAFIDDVPYDYGSDMHYGKRAFVNSGDLDVLTIQTGIPEFRDRIGDRRGLSFYDAKTANLAYCNEPGSPCQRGLMTAACEQGGYWNPNTCNTCLCPAGLAGDNCESVAPSEGTTEGGVINIACGTGFQSLQSTLTAASGTRRAYWRLKAPESATIDFQLTQISSLCFSNGQSCEYRYGCPDWLEVVYMPLGGPGPWFCAGNTYGNPVITSTQNEMVVIAQANYNYQFGFTFQYRERFSSVFSHGSLIFSNLPGVNNCGSTSHSSFCTDATGYSPLRGGTGMHRECEFLRRVHGQLTDPPYCCYGWTLRQKGKIYA